MLTESDLPKEFFYSPDIDNNNFVDNLQEVEKKHILNVLRSSNFNKAKAAEILGIGLTTLYRKLNEYGLPGE